MNYVVVSPRSKISIQGDIFIDTGFFPPTPFTLIFEQVNLPSDVVFLLVGKGRNALVYSQWLMLLTFTIINTCAARCFSEYPHVFLFMDMNENCFGIYT